MNVARQREKAEAFRRMHEGPGALLQVNCWDAGSARVLEATGFPAVATSSAGLAYGLGFSDGENLPLDDLLWMVQRITRAVQIPVSVDFEMGYAGTPEGAAANCRHLIEAGGIGINLEDATRDQTHPLVETTAHAAKICAIREMAADTGVPLVINARTDVFWRKVGAEETRLDRAIERANAYRKAGADSLFIPGVIDLPTIEKLVRGIAGPVNILAMPGAPPIAELERAGVKRVSLGAWPARTALGILRRAAAEVKDKSTYGTLAEFAMTSPEAVEIFKASTRNA